MPTAGARRHPGLRSVVSAVLLLARYRPGILASR
jgi:hypothetical protein